MDPAKWDYRTAELSLEEEAALLRIVNAIHKHDAAVPNIDRVLAGMFRCSTRKARALVAALVKAGKVIIEDGVIWSERARSDLVQRRFASVSRAESGAKGGRTRAENAANPLTDNEAGQAIASPRIEENRIDTDRANALSVESRASVASFQTPLPPDPPPKRSPPRKQVPPADWSADDAQREYARAAGLSLEEIDRAERSFRNWHQAERKTRAPSHNFDAAWRCWVDRDAERRRSLAVGSPASGGGGRSSIASAAARRINGFPR
jgi:hypothetical protein